MADIVNRSRFCVTVRNREDLTRFFPFDRLEEALAYKAQLLAQKLKPRARQLEARFLVRIRQTGYKDVSTTFSSEADAQDFVNRGIGLRT